MGILIVGLAYLVHALLRGVWLQSDPYPFIDVTAPGYRQTLLNPAGLLIALLLLGSGLVAISRAPQTAAALSRRCTSGCCTLRAVPMA